MERIVLDTNVFIAAGLSTRSKTRRIFVAAARRRFQLAVTSDIVNEYEEVSRRPAFAGKNYAGLLAWVRTHAVLVEPAALGKQRSRDRDDDVFLACALAAGAKTIVSDDLHLLRLGKPFGIEIVSSAGFIARRGL